nr:FecR domain-containing protein [Pseudomonas brassicae]
MTRTGETRRVTLDDGSQIVLDADTHLHVLLGASNRQVYLLRGRAMFSVRHAPTRPFTVDAGAAQVRVLGTRFVVERLAPQVQVSVAEGRVSFASQGASMLLTSDQVGELDGAGHLHRLQRSAASAFSFVEGRLSFEGATLGEIAAALSRYRRVPLQAVQPQAHAITAVVQIADLEHFVTLLPQLAPVSLQTQDGVTLLVPR